MKIPEKYEDNSQQADYAWLIKKIDKIIEKYEYDQGPEGEVSAAAVEIVDMLIEEDIFE